MGTSKSEQLSTAVNDLLAVLSSVVCEGTEFRNFPHDLTEELLLDITGKLALVTSYINTIRNFRRSPICSLPPEVLDNIFNITRPTLPLPSKCSVETRHPSPQPIKARSRYTSTRQASLSSWHPVRLTGVCRYWRAITLLSPSVWATVQLGDKQRLTCANLQLAQLCLRRSYYAPVDVHISTEIRDGALSWVTETLASQSMRFRTFRMVDFAYDARFLEHFWECPAPLLQDLVLFPTHTAPYPMPMMFAGYTPMLQRLTLGGFTCWRENLFKNLQTLRLEEAGQDLSYAEFLDFLSCSPCLEELTWTHSDLRDVYDVSPTLQVTLPRLRSIHIRSVPSICVARVLSHIQPSITLSLTVRDLPADGLRSTSILSAVSRIDAMRNVTRILFDTEPAQHRRLKLSGCGLSSFELASGADMHEVASNQYMAALVGLLTACNISELWVNREEVIMREGLWQRILFPIPSIRKLVFMRPKPWQDTNLGLVSALYAPDESVGLALPCPALQELVVVHADYAFAIDQTMLHNIKAFLQQRHKKGFPVSKIRFLDINDWNEPAPHPRPKSVILTSVAKLRELAADVRMEYVKHLPEIETLFARGDVTMDEVNVVVSI